MEILFSKVVRVNSEFYADTYCMIAENDDDYQKVFKGLKEELTEDELEVLSKEMSDEQDFTLYVEKKGVVEKIPVYGFVYKVCMDHLSSTRIYLKKSCVRKSQLKRISDCGVKEYELDWF